MNKYLKLHLIFTICLILCSSFYACSNDDKENSNNLDLSIDYLNQSEWTGQYIIKEKDGKINETYTIGFSFTSENRGKFTIFSNVSEEFDITEYMKYSVDKRNLIMTNEVGNATTMLGSGWMVIEKNNNSMVLVKDPTTEIFTRYLYLDRIY